jgi:hypothetical protein
MFRTCFPACVLELLLDTVGADTETGSETGFVTDVEIGNEAGSETEVESDVTAVAVIVDKPDACLVLSPTIPSATRLDSIWNLTTAWYGSEFKIPSTAPHQYPWVFKVSCNCIASVLLEFSARLEAVAASILTENSPVNKNDNMKTGSIIFFVNIYKLLSKRLFDSLRTIDSFNRLTSSAVYTV